MDSKGKFHTMNILNEDHGLVDRAFAIQFGNELGPNWFLVDVENNRFIVKYNMDLYMPKLIGGAPCRGERLEKYNQVSF
ncbi:hypothetical protein ACSQ67_010980 [Phaseolus vulgaris]